MNQQLTDTDIIAGLGNNDSRSFELLFRELYPSLCYFAGSLIEDKEQAQDIVSDSFMKLWNIRERFDTIVNIKAFLYITTRNACFDYLKMKKRQKEQQKELVYLQPVTENLAEELEIITEVLEKIYREIQKLPEKCRQVFMLHFFAGKTNDEIARQLQVAGSTVRNQKARAIMLLKKILSEKELLVLYLFLSSSCYQLSLDIQSGKCALKKSATAAATTSPTTIDIKSGNLLICSLAVKDQQFQSLVMPS